MLHRLKNLHGLSHAFRNAVRVAVLVIAAMQLVISWPLSATQSALISWHEMITVAESSPSEADQASHHCDAATDIDQTAADSATPGCDVCGEHCQGIAYCAHCGLGSLVDLQKLLAPISRADSTLRLIAFQNIVRSDDGHSRSLDRPPNLFA